MSTKNHKAIIDKIKNKGEKSSLQNLTKTDVLNPSKKDVYDTFVLWYSIPLALKNLSQMEREKMNLSDVVMELTTIRSQDQFCKKYNVSRMTILEWKKKTPWSEIDTGMKTWMKMLTANWRLAVYKKTMSTGSASEAMFLEKIVNDYTDKITMTNSSHIYVVDEEQKQKIKNSFKRNAHRR